MNFYFGVVEDINDPRELGRVRVRVYGIHTHDKTKIPTDTLPWATVIQPTTSAANSGIGETPRLINGSLVCLFFTDPNDMQYPVVFGTVPSELSDQFLIVDGINVKRGNQNIGFQDPNKRYPTAAYYNENDLPKLARSVDPEFIRRPESFKNSLFIFEEPEDLRPKHQYPFNQVKQSQAGHHEEWDDTPGNERINRQHSSGTFQEWRPDGTEVVKIYHDRYTLIADSDSIYVGGNVNVHINGDSNLFIQGNHTEHIAGNFYQQIDGDKVSVIQGNVTEQVFGSRDVLTKGQQKVQVDGDNKELFRSNSNVEVQNNKTILVGGSFSEQVDGASNTNIGGSQTNVVGGSVAQTFGSMSTLTSGNISFDGNRIDWNSGVSPSVSVSALSNNPEQNPLTVLEPVEYSLRFAAPIIDAAGRFAPFDEEEVINKTPAEYPQDTERRETVTVAQVGENKTKPVEPPPQEIGDRVDYNLQISPSFRLGDFSKFCIFSHDIVAQHGLKTSDITRNLQSLAVNCAEVIASEFPGVRINSGFRKGSGRSQHERGMACDMQWPGLATQEYLRRAKWIAENVNFDQLLFEHGNSIWIHVSFNRNGTNRKQVLTMYRGKFEPGLKLYY